MGLLDILRGQRTPKRANLDRLFALSTAQQTLSINLALEPVGKAGVCFKPVEAGPFEELVRELDQLLELATRSSGTTITRTQDSYGFRWIVLEDQDFDDLVTTTHLINQTIEERGFSERLLASVFGFQGAEGKVYFVYAYKRGTFYPFAPRGESERDTALELRLRGALQNELPIEPELERWYPVWGVPL